MSIMPSVTADHHRIATDNADPAARITYLLILRNEIVEKARSYAAEMSADAAKAAWLTNALAHLIEFELEVPRTLKDSSIARFFKGQVVRECGRRGWPGVQRQIRFAAMKIINVWLVYGDLEGIIDEPIVTADHHRIAAANADPAARITYIKILRNEIGEKARSYALEISADAAKTAWLSNALTHLIEFELEVPRTLKASSIERFFKTKVVRECGRRGWPGVQRQIRFAAMKIINVWLVYGDLRGIIDEPAAKNLVSRLAV